MSVFLRAGAAAICAFGAVTVLATADRAQAGAPGPAAASAAAAPSEWRIVDPENTLVIDTTKGRVIVEMRPDVNPEAVERIKTLTRRGFYDSLAFFRVIDGFMDQTGDPQNNGVGQSDLPNLVGRFTFKRSPETPFTAVAVKPGGEIGFVGTMPATSQASGLMMLTADGMVAAYQHFCPGVTAMARASESDSANSQFFLMRADNPALEKRYSAWGRVVIGLDVVRSIAVGGPPANPDRMNTVKVAADIPAAQRPSVRVLDAASPTFKAAVAAARAAKGAAFTACDVDFPARGG